MCLAKVSVTPQGSVGEGKVLDVQVAEELGGYGVVTTFGKVSTADEISTTQVNADMHV